MFTEKIKTNYHFRLKNFNNSYYISEYAVDASFYEYCNVKNIKLFLK